MDIVEGVEGCSLILKNDELRWFRLEGFALSRGGGPSTPKLREEEKG